MTANGAAEALAILVAILAESEPTRDLRPTSELDAESAAESLAEARKDARSIPVSSSRRHGFGDGDAGFGRWSS